MRRVTGQARDRARPQEHTNAITVECQRSHERIDDADAVCADAGPVQHDARHDIDVLT